eukprot:14827582-Alexandrium_andersonii.AAC.1
MKDRRAHRNKDRHVGRQAQTDIYRHTRADNHVCRCSQAQPDTYRPGQCAQADNHTDHGAARQLCSSMRVCEHTGACAPRARVRTARAQAHALAQARARPPSFARAFARTRACVRASKCVRARE